MTIFDRATVRPTGFRRPDRTHAPSLELSCAPTGETQMLQHSIQSEYALLVGVQQNFFANEAQFPSAREHALRSAAAFLYADVLPALAHLELLVASGDWEEALQAVGRIRKAIQP